MTPEAIVYQTLSANAPLTALVGTKISTELSLDDYATDYIVYTMIGARPDYTQDGPTDMQAPSVQIDCYSLDYGNARAIARAVVKALDGPNNISPPTERYFFITNDGTDMFDPSPRKKRVMVEAITWYRNT